MFCRRYRGAVAPIMFVASLVLGGFARPAAADFIMTVSGDFASSFTTSYQFDGTDLVVDAMPSMYDVAALTGGTFTATFTFPAVTAPPSGNFTTYVFGPGYGLNYTLFNATGVVVHHGSNTSDALAMVFDNAALGGPPMDAANLFAFVNDVSGLLVPPALYGPPEVYAIQSALFFNGEVSGSTNFITGLGLPTDAATYLSFPIKTFSTGMQFGDGDWIKGVKPFQYEESYVEYSITNVSIVVVPAPATMVILIAGMCGARRRRRE